MNNIMKINNSEDANRLISINDKKIEQLPEVERESFKENFLSICSDKYLTSKANAQDIFNLALNATKIGLNVSKYAKEVYILPFGNKLEMVFRKEATEKLLSDRGYFIECTNIWSIDGLDVLENELSYGQQARLEKTNPKFVNDFFIGFMFKLSYIRGDKSIPDQFSVIGVNYLNTVTKQLQSQEHKIANWSHKAYRKAYSTFNLSASAGASQMDEKIAKLDDINYSDNDNIIDADVKVPIVNSDNSSTDPMQFAKQSEEITPQTIREFYKNLDAQKKGLALKEITTYGDLKEQPKDALKMLLATLKEL